MLGLERPTIGVKFCARGATCQAVGGENGRNFCWSASAKSGTTSKTRDPSDPIGRTQKLESLFEPARRCTGACCDDDDGGGGGGDDDDHKINSPIYQRTRKLGRFEAGGGARRPLRTVQLSRSKIAFKLAEATTTTRSRLLPRFWSGVSGESFPLQCDRKFGFKSRPGFTKKCPKC